MSRAIVAHVYMAPDSTIILITGDRVRLRVAKGERRRSLSQILNAMSTTVRDVRVRANRRISDLLEQIPFVATVKATNATTAFLTSSAKMRVVKEVRLAKYNALIPEALDETHQRTDFIALGWKGQCIPSPPKAEIRSRPPSFELLSQTTQSRYVYED